MNYDYETLYPWLGDTNPEDFESLDEIDDYFKSIYNENVCEKKYICDLVKDLWRESNE